MTRQLSVGLLIKNDTVRAAFREILASHVEFVSSESGASGIPDLVILELEEADPAKTFSYITSLLRSAPSSTVFLTGARAESDILLEAIRTGVKEFLPQPVKKAEVEQALERLQERRNHVHQSPEQQRGTIFSVLGAKGGVGTSSVAVNLAVALQLLEPTKSVALVDLDLEGNDLAVLLNLDPVGSIQDIVHDPSRLDRTFLLSLGSKHESGVYLLPLGYNNQTVGRPHSECLQQVLGLMRTVFDYVLIDCGHALDEFILKALELSDTIIVVSMLSLPVVRRTKHLLDVFRQHGHAFVKIALLMNRCAPANRVLLAESEAALRQKAFWLIPDDYDLVGRAINTGKPLTTVAPRSALAKSYTQLAGAFIHDHLQPKEGSGLRNRLRALMATW